MVTGYDRLTNELKRTCIRLNDELIFSPQEYKNEVFYHIELPAVSKFFRIGYSEYVFISLFDGQTTFAHALAVTAQQLGNDALTEQQAIKTVHWLIESGLASDADGSAMLDAKEQENDQAAIWKNLNPFWLKLPLSRSNHIFEWLQPYCRWLFRPVTVMSSILLITVAFLTVVLNWSSFAASSHDVFAPSNWLWMVLTWLFLKGLHELAHGITCNRFGGTVKESGIIFILLAPMAYVDVTSSWRFSSRWKRIAVAGAGMVVEWVVASLCVIAWCFTSSELVAHQLFNVVLLASVSTFLFNANPLMRFDGYFILSDLMKIPNLYSAGSQSFHDSMSWLFFGRKANATCCELKHHRRFVTIYGIAATIWKVLICIGIAITASLMFHGLGIFLSLLGVFCWLAGPIKRMVGDLVRRRNAQPHSLIRAGLVASSVAFLMASSWFLIPNPFSDRSPCLVDFHELSKIRADSSGFVKRVYVGDGQLVQQGETLIQLENRELSAEITELKAQLNQEITRERIAIDDNRPAQAQVEKRNQQATSKKLCEKQQQLDGLVITAPTTGRVVARNLRQSVGTYVTHGDVLLSIGDEEHKEIVLLVSTENANAATDLIGKSVPVKIGMHPPFLARIRRADPKASSQIAHPSLTAPNGGRLVVKPKQRHDREPSDSESLELCEPRIHAIASINGPTSRQLFAGERGFVVLESNSPTLGQWVFHSVHDWINRQLQQAL